MSGVEIKMLHAGAITQVVRAVVPEFEKQTGHKVTLHRDTAGALTKLIEGGEPFDLALLTPGAIDKLTEKGKFVRGSRTNIARVGVGVVVKEGTPLPDISTRRGVQERAAQGEDRSPISTRMPAARAASMSRDSWRSSASPRRSTPRRS